MTLTITRGRIVRYGAAAAAVISIGVLGACGQPSKQDAEEPTVDQMVQLDKAKVIQNPEGFRNVSFGCLPGTQNGIYVTSRGAAADATPAASSVFVVPNDPACSR